jgi:diaminopimelate epimerase
MKIEFTKMSGAGNDFIFLGPDCAFIKERAPDLARRLCKRRTSVGADGLVLVEPAGDIIDMIYFNSDGSEASFCGNGARCLVLYCALKGIAAGEIRFRSGSGEHAGDVTENGVRISMAAPRLLRKLTVEAGGRSFEVSLIEAGVPHAVIMTEDVSAVDVESLGPGIRHNDEFGPEGVNVDFVQAGPELNSIRTYERGVEAETLACGSGCLAAALALKLTRGTDDMVALKVASGDVLTVELPGTGSRPAHLVGPARVVFEGQVELDGI